MVLLREEERVDCAAGQFTTVATVVILQDPREHIKRLNCFRITCQISLSRRSAESELPQLLASDPI